MILGEFSVAVGDSDSIHATMDLTERFAGLAGVAALGGVSSAGAWVAEERRTRFEEKLFGRPPAWRGRSRIPGLSSIALGVSGVLGGVDE